LTTTAAMAYGVELHAPTSAITDTAGMTVTYMVHVTNTGNTTDTFDINVDGEWTTTAMPLSVELGAGEMGMFYVTVQIPASAAAGESDVATVMVTSAGDATAMDTVELTTTATAVPQTEFTIYLPLISKP
jgi:uncharacterized membrane protein